MTRHRFDLLSRLVLLELACLAAPIAAAEIDGFTEPYRTVEIAAPEMGIITAINVRVGDLVRQGEVVATLDDDIHQLLVESAEARKQARGNLESAQAELKLRETRHAKIKEVVARGHGRNEEVERAQADMEIAAANLLVAQDDILFKTLDHRRLTAELARRKIRSPLDGVVSQNLKEVGEFVAPNDPQILKVVQLNPLLAKFSLGRSRAERVSIGDTMHVSFPNVPQPIPGVVEEISPVIDAESGTIRIKVRIDNVAGQLRSGQRCLLQMRDLLDDSTNDSLDFTAARPVENSAGVVAELFGKNSLTDTGPGRN